MNKQELIAEIANRTGYTKKDCGKCVDLFCEIVKEQLVKGDRVKIIDFGTFDTVARKERVGRNPRKPDEKIVIPARTSPRFEAGKALKEAVKNVSK